jgi:hypothetical protein
VYDVFAIADHVKKSGDAMTGALTNIDVNGTELILDADGDTSIDASSDDVMTFKTGGSERMKISSDGYITKPNQPVFCATHPTGATLTTDTTFRVKPHDTIITNIGSGYSTAGGGSRFTAPVAGTYMFVAYALQLADFGSFLIFGKNGSHTTHGTNGEARAITPSSTEVNVSMQLILTLAQNDYVEVFYKRTSGTGGWYSAHAGFSGFLIG